MEKKEPNGTYFEESKNSTFVKSDEFTEIRQAIVTNDDTSLITYIDWGYSLFGDLSLVFTFCFFL